MQCSHKTYIKKRRHNSYHGCVIMELIGKVVKLGKIKDYGHETNFGKDWSSDFKFFIQIETDKGTVNVMVQCKAEQTDYGYRIPKDEKRQKPFVGETVKLTTRSLRPGSDGASWASATWNQSFEITEENKEAREERLKFIEQKKQERKDEFQAKIDERKKQNEERKQARLAELESQKKDERLPESVRNEISKTFDLEKIIRILRDTVWFTMEEGEGGKRAVYSLSGAILEEGYPGSGMQRPNGPLHDLPASVRKSVLSKAVKSGLII